MQTHTRTHTGTHMYMHGHGCPHTQTNAHTHKQTHTHKQMHAITCAYTCVHTKMHSICSHSCITSFCSHLSYPCVCYAEATSHHIRTVRSWHTLKQRLQSISFPSTLTFSRRQRKTLLRMGTVPKGGSKDEEGSQVCA